LAGVFADLGLIDKEDLKTFNLTGSKLGMHLDCNKVKGLDTSTGSLGHGPSLALGIAYAARLNKQSYKTYLITGDGELDEGSCWEAFMAIGHFKMTSLVTIIDRNHYSIDGNTEDIMTLEPLADKMKAFNFDVKVINGHNFKEICEAIEYAQNATDKPVCIIADTVKGEGMELTAGNYKWHYGAMDDARYEKCKADLAAYKAKRLARAEKEGE
jgi:Transketolase, N-terminal subunit